MRFSRKDLIFLFFSIEKYVRRTVKGVKWKHRTVKRMFLNSPPSHSKIFPVVSPNGHAWKTSVDQAEWRIDIYGWWDLATHPERWAVGSGYVSRKITDSVCPILPSDSILGEFDQSSVMFSNFHRLFILVVCYDETTSNLYSFYLSWNRLDLSLRLMMGVVGLQHCGFDEFDFFLAKSGVIRWNRDFSKWTKQLRYPSIIGQSGGLFRETGGN